MTHEQTPLDAALEIANDFGFDKATIKQIEDLAVPEVKQLSPKQILTIRIKANCSQGVMARYLNVNPSTYQKWERGEVVPKGAPLKLLNIAYGKGIDALS